MVAAVPATTNTVAESQPIVTQPAVEPPQPPAVPTNAPTVAETNLPTAVLPDTNAAPVVDTNPPPPRIVSHEGYVRSSVSIVAPTYFELYDPVNGKAINYLYSTTTNLNLSRYNGLQIIVTGEEGLDARWKDTPVLTVQKIYVLSTNAPVAKSAPEKPVTTSFPKSRGR